MTSESLTATYAVVLFDNSSSVHFLTSFIRICWMREVLLKRQRTESAKMRCTKCPILHIVMQDFMRQLLQNDILNLIKEWLSPWRLCPTYIRYSTWPMSTTVHYCTYSSVLTWSIICIDTKQACFFWRFRTDVSVLNADSLQMCRFVPLSLQTCKSMLTTDNTATVIRVDLWKCPWFKPSTSAL